MIGNVYLLLQVIPALRVGMARTGTSHQNGCSWPHYAALLPTVA